ncbi:nuclear transport factor 2 family protein [Nocardioides speluncae]|uniref:nuclear transport factor 2 family protein n=1 Tax=Nocardioides speluncae TaxID=2670337 RepID=UPI00137A0564|nr:nuclear transport factor 2 family protein [Nocardioides speluncae]
MFSTVVGVLLRRSIKALNAGDIGPALSSYAEDAVLVFPGESTFGGSYRGRSEIEPFLRRFVDLGLQMQVDKVVATGLPWRMTVYVEARDHTKEQAGGQPVYANRLVIVCRAKWGRITHQEDYLDTQRVAGYDAHRAAAG